MIDMLVLRCDFPRNTPYQNGTQWGYSAFSLRELGIPTEQSISKDGEVLGTRHPWERIPSSYEHMAFKVVDHRFDSLDCFYIEIKASPAKLMLGHNVYGSSDFYDCCMTMIELLLTAYPVFGERLDHVTWSLAQIDITYSSRAKDDHEARLFINALHSVSFGQTKARTGYDGTAYFGKKNSRLKKIKVYGKYAELQETVKKNSKKPAFEQFSDIYNQALQDFAKGLIRWEVSLYHRYFERLGISLRLKDLFKNQSLSPTYLQTYWRLATHDLFKALEGQQMKLINDIDVHQELRLRFSKTSEKTGKTSTALADSAFRTYRDIRRDGWQNALDSMSRVTFWRHIKMLTDCGLSRAALQNMKGLNDGAQIIPFVKFIQVDFANQFPEGYQLPEPKHVYQPVQPQLRLVS